MEKVGEFIKGIYRDVLTSGDGRIIHDSGWTGNTIVDSCRILLAGFIKNETSTGIQYLAVGQGSDTWDAQGPPPSDPATTKDLVHRCLDQPLDSLNLAYLDKDMNVVGQPTNRLQITATLVPGYPTPLSPLNTYPLR